MQLKPILLSLVVALAGMAGAQAQTSQPADHAAHHPEPGASAAQELLSEGVVRRVNLEAGKVTLRHGPLANLDMPAMTMVFTAADPSLLQGLKEGDKVRFNADKKDGTFVVTGIQVVQ